MKKIRRKLVCFLLGFIMVASTTIPVFATTTSEFTYNGTEGENSLSRGTTSATGYTMYGTKNTSATRHVEVTIQVSYNGTTSSVSDSATVNTTSTIGTSNKASVTVYRPSSNYTVKSATSSHYTKYGTKTLNSCTLSE